VPTAPPLLSKGKTLPQGSFLFTFLLVYSPWAILSLPFWMPWVISAAFIPKMGSRKIPVLNSWSMMLPLFPGSTPSTFNIFVGSRILPSSSTGRIICFSVTDISFFSALSLVLFAWHVVFSWFRVELIAIDFYPHFTHSTVMNMLLHFHHIDPAKFSLNIPSDRVVPRTVSHTSPFVKETILLFVRIRES